MISSNLVVRNLFCGFANLLNYQYSYSNFVAKEKGICVTENDAEYETNMQADVGQVVQQLTEVEGEEQAEVFSEILNDSEPGTIALALESLPLDERYERWQQVEFADRVTVLSLMRADPRMGILKRMPDNEVDLLFAQLSPEDLIEWSDYLPESFTDRALAQMGERQRQRRAVLADRGLRSHPALDQAG